MTVENLPPHPELSLPPPDELNKNFIIDQIQDKIEDFKDLFPKVNLDVLLKQVTDVKEKHVCAEAQTRQFLQAFKNTDTFKNAFGELDPETQKKILDFQEGTSAEKVCEGGFTLPPSPGVKHHFKFLDKLHAFFQELHNDFSNGHAPHHLFFDKEEQKVPVVYEDATQKKVMKAYSGVPFTNWAGNIHQTPRYTFVPTTVLGLQNVVKFCKEQNLRIRVGGYRHSWSPSFAGDDEVLISMLDLHAVTRFPDPLALGVDTGIAGNEMATIDLLTKTAFGKPGKEYVRVGSAVTSEAFRKWSIKNKKYALPMDAILVEVTIGGVINPICHGAGRRWGSMSDMVRAIEYVDANGTLQTVTDPQQLKAAAGSFGLLGVTTHITFELEPMIYAVMKPTKPPIALAIPPLDPSEIPKALRKDPGPSAQEFKAARKDFENRATNDYYSEWFWFTYQPTAWVNTWNETVDGEGSVDYPSPPLVFLQWLETWIGGWLHQTFFFQHIPAHWQAQFLAIGGMAVLPPTTFDKPAMTIKAPLPDGLHFQRGIQNMRCRSMEWQIPLPKLTSDPTKPDVSVVQRAWWDIINLVYAEAGEGRSPMRLTLELRIMGGGEMLMAAQRGNDFGTASIEVVTVPGLDEEEWEEFKQKVTDIWLSYKDNEGRLLNSRPHWAKEWQGLKTKDGVPIRKHLRESAYKDAIPEFKAQLSEIGKAQGWKLEDLQKRFSNQMWDEIVFS